VAVSPPNISEFEPLSSPKMKKCACCGKEYVDEAIRCLIDGELLVGDASEPLATPAEISATDSTPSPRPSPPGEANPTPGSAWTDRQQRLFELALVCLIAFGGSILSSAYRLSNTPLPDSVASPGAMSWVNTLLHEGACIGLLWYVLMRRSRTFSDLGLSWVKSDFGYSILIYIAGTVGFYTVYAVITSTGFATVGAPASIARVAHHLFGRGITFATMLVQFLNPFYEELIVRAYVMTEMKQLTHSVWKPIVLSTLLQMSYHFYQGAPMAFSSGAMFLVFSIYFSRTNRIAPVILAHLYSDVGATVLYALHQRQGGLPYH
jgi:membrane protease YdiL (CAAX protease family)